MKILMTQLQNQDPMNPMKEDDYLKQMAQMATEKWNTRPIEDELNRRIAKAKDLLNAEMGMWRSVPTGNLPDHFIQLRQVLDVLDGGGE